MENKKVVTVLDQKIDDLEHELSHNTHSTNQVREIITDSGYDLDGRLDGKSLSYILTVLNANGFSIENRLEKLKRYLKEI